MHSIKTPELSHFGGQSPLLETCDQINKSPMETTILARMDDYTLKIQTQKITLLEKMRFIKVDELKLTQIQLF